MPPTIGVVEDVGRNVRNLKAGDRVFVLEVTSAIDADRAFDTRQGQDRARAAGGAAMAGSAALAAPPADRAPVADLRRPDRPARRSTREAISAIMPA